MLNYTAIRPDFICKYSEIHRKMRHESWTLIAKRDELLRKLNCEFGYYSDDGSVGIGCYSYIDGEYKKRYDEIETRFHAQYDTQLPNIYDLCRQNGITIFEYLLLDNIDLIDEDASSLTEAFDRHHNLYFDPIKFKANLFVHDLIKDNTVGEMKRRIAIEINHQWHAGNRCREFFKINPWQINQQMVIFDYRRRWKLSLFRVFENLKAT